MLRRSHREDLPAGTSLKKVNSSGTLGLDGVQYKIDGRYGFRDVLVIIDGDHITVADPEGEILAEYTRPEPGARYVGNGRPRGPHTKTPGPSPMS